MYVVMSGNGHVGSATAAELLDRGEKVTVVVRDVAAAEGLQSRGATVVTADAGDSESLRQAFRTGRRALLVNPPADPAGDTDVAERRTIEAILRAVADSDLEKVVAVSTYGVRPGERIGDLGTLWTLEQGLERLGVPSAINRHAYSMTNWDVFLPTVRDRGVLPSSLPVDLRLPMVAPADLGVAAADRLMSGVDDVGVVHVEGPDRYTPADVAAEFSAALSRPVAVDVTPLDRLEGMFAGMGFSGEAAASYAAMTRLTVDGLQNPGNPLRGAATLRSHITALTSRPREV